MWQTRRGGGRETAEDRARLRDKYPASRRPLRRLSDRRIRSTALAWLLPLLAGALTRRFRPSTLRDTGDLLLRAATLRSSVHRARAQCRRGCSDRTARWLFDHLTLGRTQRALTLALRRQIRPFVPKEPVDVAIDFHDRPYYGQPLDPKRRQYVRTKEERGTHRAHRFASLSILLPDFRLVASLRFHPSNGRTLPAVQQALHDFRQAGGQLKAVFLDRGFYNYAVLSWLKAEGISAVVPLRLGSRQRKKWERGHGSYSTTHTLKGPKAGQPPLELTIHVVVRYQKGKKWNRRGCQYWIYAVLGDIPLREVADRYRGRFGIESSYRILGQALARTSSRSPALRLLHVGVGMMLQNEWVVLKVLYASERRKGRGGFRVRQERLRFVDLLLMLLQAVGYRLGNLTALENRGRIPGQLWRQGWSEFLDV
ncbi:MAG: transposase [Thermoplasmata archaeon]